MLGVLDVTLSLADVDRGGGGEPALDRWPAPLSSIVAISVLLTLAFHRLVGRPVGRLLAATSAVANGRPRLPHPGAPPGRARPARGVVQRDDRAPGRGASPGLPVEQAGLGRAARRRHRARDQQPADGSADLLELPAQARHRRAETREDLEIDRPRDQALPRHRARTARLRAPGAAEEVDDLVNDVAGRALAIVDNQLHVQNVAVASGSTRSCRRSTPIPTRSSRCWSTCWSTRPTPSKAPSAGWSWSPGARASRDGRSSSSRSPTTARAFSKKDLRKDLRAVLHHQGAQGDRARPRRLLGDRQRARRHHRGGERGRYAAPVHGPSAASRGRTPSWRGASHEAELRRAAGRGRAGRAWKPRRAS